MSTQPLPKFVTRYFWGDNLDELDMVKNKQYIAQVLLERGDQHAISWLLSTMDRQTLKNDLKNLPLSKKSANFWHIYFS